MTVCHLWALQSSSLTPTGRAVRHQLLTVRQTPPEQRWARKTTLVAPLIRQAAAAAPHSSTLFLCLLTTLCPTAQNTKSSAEVGKKKCGGYGGGGKNEKKIPPYNINKLWQRQRGFFLAPTELLGIYFLTLHPPFSFKRYDSYCSNQPGWMEGTEAKPAPGVNTPVWKRPYCSNPALLTCPSTTSFLK